MAGESRIQVSDMLVGRKLRSVLGFVAAVAATGLVSCQRNPVISSPDLPSVVLVDAFTEKPLQHVPVHVGGWTGYTDEAGFLQLPGDSAELEIRIFPYKSKRVPRDSLRGQRLAMRLPPPLTRYEALLVFAKLNGYRMLGVYAWFTNRERLKSRSFLILRHDVDYDPETAKALAFIERLVGARSTFYFRWVTEKPEAVEYVKNLGHEVGLHYETLALYCEGHGITDPDSVTPEVLTAARRMLRREIANFESRYGDIHSIASHGAARNRLLGIPNAALTENQNLASFGVEVDASLLEWHLVCENLDVFVADSGHRWKPFPLIEALRARYGHVYSLLHPCWWRPREWGRFVVVRP